MNTNWQWMGRVLLYAGLLGVWAILALDVQRQVRKSEAQLKAFYDRQERIRTRAAQFQKEVANALARAGQGVGALNGARALANRLEEMGFDRRTAIGICPFVVDEQGRRIVSDQEVVRIAAGIQCGIVRPMNGQSSAERGTAIRRAVRDVKRSNEAVRNAEAQILDEEARRRAAAAAGDVDEIKRMLVRYEGY